MGGEAHMPQCTYGGQRPACRSHLSLFIMWAPRIERRSSGLAARMLNCSDVTDLRISTFSIMGGKTRWYCPLGQKYKLVTLVICLGLVINSGHLPASWRADMVHTCASSMWEADRRISASSGPAWATQWVPCQPQLQGKTLLHMSYTYIHACSLMFVHIQFF